MRKLLALTAILALCISCTVVSRYVRYGYKGIYSYKIFPHTVIDTGHSVFRFKQGDSGEAEKYLVQSARWLKGDSALMPLGDFLEKTSTVSFLVIRNDSILFERYYKGFDRGSISTIFSISKSVTSLLTGLAVEDGYIGSVTDTVMKYVPELKGHAPEYGRLTIRNLLNMRAGFKFSEDYKINPFSGMAKLYYGTNQLGQLKRMKFAYEPGSVRHYQSASTALLGIAVEEASGKSLGKYLQEKIWIPLGMENPATWSLDDKRHRRTKAYGGLNASAIDLAKIGRLYLNGGRYDGRQIIDSAWVAASVTPLMWNDGYQYQWRSHGVSITKDGSMFFPDSTSAAKSIEAMDDRFRRHYTVWQSKKNQQWRATSYVDFYALGIQDQVLYVNPDKNVIVVRLGEKEDLDYVWFIYKLIEQL